MRFRSRFWFIVKSVEQGIAAPSLIRITNMFDLAAISAALDRGQKVCFQERGGVQVRLVPKSLSDINPSPVTESYLL
jgi:uncharacterized membrane protein